jgi:stage V sporulation protein S
LTEKNIYLESPTFVCLASNLITERKIPAMDVIKVKANSRTAAVAGAIAGVVREHKRAEVQAIGAGAVNQAVKALVLAKGYLAEDGISVVCIPEFVDVDIEGKVRTAIKLTIEPR